MISKALELDGSGQDGMLVTWEPGQLLVTDAQAAFKAASAESLLPKSSTKPNALRTAFSAMIDALNIKVRGTPIHITPLREDLVGFEARRVLKGDVENDPEFALSVLLDEASGSPVIKIAKHDDNICPAVGLMKDSFEATLLEVYQQELLYYPVSMVSSALQRLIKRLGGISLRRAGGSYFLPSSSLTTFNKVADALEKPGCDLVFNTITFPIKPGERSYRWVLDSLRKEVEADLAEIQEELQDLGGRKQRSNGMETRLEHATRIDQKVSQYEGLLNVTLTDLHDAVNVVRTAVESHNLMEICS